MTQYHSRTLLSYCLVIGAALSLSWLIYANQQQQSRSTEQLFNHSLPQLRAIGQLQQNLQRYERLLYEYYATTDRPRLSPQLKRVRQHIVDYRQVIADSDLYKQIEQPLSQALQTLTNNAEALDDTLTPRRVDWDRARELLIIISSASRDMEPLLEQLMQAIEQQAAGTSDHNLKSGQLASQLVIAFCLAVTLIALMIGFYIDRYLRESAERRRLAMFAERNPNPVLSTNWQGELLYRNPAAVEFISTITHARSEPVLPSKLFAQLKYLIASSDDTLADTLQLGSRYWHYTFSLVRDLNICHMHLEDVTERTLTKQRLEFQALHDGLTELPNRRQLEAQLQVTTTVINQSLPRELLLLSIHRFDRITANHGYQLGDQLIQQVAKRLQDCLQQQSQHYLQSRLFRLDGTSFGLLLCHRADTPADATNSTAFLLQQAMEQPFQHQDNQFHLTLRIGISCYPENTQRVDQLLRNADAALVAAKQTNQSAIQLYSEQLQQQQQQLMQIESELRQPDCQQQLCLHYQPKVDAQSGKITGCEALMRWFKNGQIHYSPAEFIAVAEQSGLIIQMGYRAIENAMQQALTWSQTLPVCIAVNLSSKQFQHANFLPRLRLLLQKYPGAEKLIEFEITESLLMHDLDASIDIMHQLKRLGFSLSIDDFGTGYSSLSYLKDFPIDKLKIDRSFIKNIAHNKDDQTLVKTIISLAHSLNLSTIAEGIETQEQLQLLRNYQCKEIQGFYFSKPLSAQEFDHRIIQANCDNRILPIIRPAAAN